MLRAIYNNVVVTFSSLPADQVCPDASGEMARLGLSYYCVPTLAEAMDYANPTGSKVTFGGVNIHDNDTSWGSALAAVDTADAVVLALGMDLSIGMEGSDSSDIGLPAIQTAFGLAVAARAASKGKPVVLVLVNGLPLSIDELMGPMDAIVEAYTPSFGAAAVGAALFGANRWGRAVTTIYPHAYQGQVRGRRGQLAYA